MSQTLGFAVSGGPNASEVVRLARLAEDLGYTSAWVAEGHGGDQFFWHGITIGLVFWVNTMSLGGCTRIKNNS